MAKNEHTILSESEERLWAVAIFLLYPMALMLAVMLTIILFNHLINLKTSEKKENEYIYYVYALRSAIISAICIICVYAVGILCLNDLFIPWDFSNNFVTAFDSIFQSFYIVNKIFVYFGFTFHIQSILNKPLPMIFKVWMFFVLISFSVSIIVMIYDDLRSYSSEEIGITSQHNIYLVLFLGGNGAVLSHIAVLCESVLDILYFVVLFIYYFSNLKKLYNPSEQGIKGLILITASIILYLMTNILIATNAPIKYIITAFVLSTYYICLFFMFKPGDQIYQNLCGCLCANCCAKIIYGSGYNRVKKKSSSGNDDENHTVQSDALL